ncbi:hypothetical protein [Streptomyces sp. AMCC400023]|uniref:hypothetical protein n=1 Tax=Streptomyces sp. AMCC400023 TaxID=2056258 RepID=UPI001F2A349D|nr:hypothetical protein [Streptomyces sp. AMCC400023]UJV42032.1 hypothetical protein CVT30_21260 [Streptomyces sp. AMCC400023]
MSTPPQRAWNGCGTPASSQPGWKKPALTEAQREDVSRRLGGGERSADLAVEFGVSVSTIRRCRNAGPA